VHFCKRRLSNTQALLRIHRFLFAVAIVRRGLPTVASRVYFHGRKEQARNGCYLWFLRLSYSSKLLHRPRKSEMKSASKGPSFSQKMRRPPGFHGRPTKRGGLLVGHRYHFKSLVLPRLTTASTATRQGSSRVAGLEGSIRRACCHRGHGRESFLAIQSQTGPYALAGGGSLTFHPTGNRGSAPVLTFRPRMAFCTAWELIMC
jgi:hypothetical protein